MSGEGVQEGACREVKEVKVLADVMPPGAGSYKYTDMKSVGSLSLTPVHGMEPSFSE